MAVFSGWNKDYLFIFILFIYLFLFIYLYFCGKAEYMGTIMSNMFWGICDPPTPANILSVEFSP